MSIVNRSMRQQLASDNYAGLCPEALAALTQANQGHAPSYGQDRWTAEACDAFRDLFETPCEVFFVLNGTAANALALASLCQSYHSIVCHRHSHIETDECGAPEFFSHGAKLLLADGPDGKLEPASVEEIITRRADIHYPKPRVISLTQSTELGTVYQPEELRGLQAIARQHGLKLHMDGARFANAAATLGLSAHALTVACGIDVLSFGGSKNGLALGEAVLFFDVAAADEFAYRCKQAGQLASKMRFLAAQWLGLLRDGAWLRYAAHANHCAALLEQELCALPEVELMFPRQANAVFVRLPESVTAALRQRGWLFYTFIGVGGARLMCAWDTEEATVRAFIADLKAALVGGVAGVVK